MDKTEGQRLGAFANQGRSDQAEILSANDKVLELFDFMEAPATWGTLRSTIPEKRREMVAGGKSYLRLFD